MRSPSIPVPALRRGHTGRVASSVVALVVLVACGIVGVAQPSSTVGGSTGVVVTAERVGRLSPDGVQPALRLQAGPSLRQLGHRSVEAASSDDAAPGLRRSRSLRVDDPSTDPSSSSSATSTRGPPSPVV